MGVFGSSSSVGVAAVEAALLRRVGVFWVPGGRRLAFDSSEPPRQSGLSRLKVACLGRRLCLRGPRSLRCGLLLGPRQSTTRLWQQRAASTVRSESSDIDVLGPTLLSQSGVPFAGGPQSLRCNVFRRGFLRFGDPRSGLVSSFLLLTSSGGFGVP